MNFDKRILLASAILLLAACASETEIAEPELAAVQASSLNITTSYGELEGMTVANGARAWLGVPFAAPPVDDLRWRATRAPESWEGVREAKDFRSRCAQRKSGGRAGAANNISEDCLYLNVWAPAEIPADTKLPVMFWIYGGGNEIGSGSDYDGSKLAQKENVIVITSNYRLDVFGWFHYPALLDTPDASPEDRSGNFGTLDQLAALNWVQDNIAAFGGDPDRVTVFGESAGAFNTNALLTSPLSEGLIDRAIIQSGGLVIADEATAVNFVDDEQPGAPQSASEIIARLLVNKGIVADRDAAKAYMDSVSSEDISAFLRGLDLADFITVEQKIFSEYAGKPGLAGTARFAPQIILDGHVITHPSYLEAIRSGDLKIDIPIMFGTNRDEDIIGLVLYGDGALKWAIPGKKFVIQDPVKYDFTAEYLSRTWRAEGVDAPAGAISEAGNPDVYSYRFDFDNFSDFYGLQIVRAETPDKSVVGASHGFDVTPIFGLEGGLGPNPESQEGYDEMSDGMMAYWAAFARDGKPGKGDGNLPEWTSWSDTPTGKGGFMMIDEPADGGFEMAYSVETSEKIWTEFNEDSRLSDEERCRLYAYFAQYPFGLSERGTRFPEADGVYAAKVGCDPFGDTSN